MAGIVSALGVSIVLKFLQKDKSEHALLMELPRYRFPDLKSVWIGLLDRAKIFLKRVGWHYFCAVDFTYGSCVRSRNRQKVQP